MLIARYMMYFIHKAFILIETVYKINCSRNRHKVETDLQLLSGAICCTTQQPYGEPVFGSVFPIFILFQSATMSSAQELPYPTMWTSNAAGLLYRDSLLSTKIPGGLHLALTAEYTLSDKDMDRRERVQQIHPGWQTVVSKARLSWKPELRQCQTEGAVLLAGRQLLDH